MLDQSGERERERESGGIIIIIARAVTRTRYENPSEMPVISWIPRKRQVNKQCSDAAKEEGASCGRHRIGAVLRVQIQVEFGCMIAQGV